MGRQHLIHLHGSSKEELEKYIYSGGTIEPGEIIIITGVERDEE